VRLGRGRRRRTILVFENHSADEAEADDLVVGQLANSPDHGVHVLVPADGVDLRVPREAAEAVAVQGSL
jgi:hypothetical protein